MSTADTEIKSESSKSRKDSKSAKPQQKAKTKSELEFFKDELKRVKEKTDEYNSSLNPPQQEPFIPYIFNPLKPYTDTRMFETAINEPPESQHFPVSRNTALGPCDPWVSLEMDLIIAPSVPSTARQSARHDRKNSSRGEGDQTNRSTDKREQKTKEEDKRNKEEDKRKEKDNGKAEDKGNKEDKRNDKDNKEDVDKKKEGNKTKGENKNKELDKKKEEDNEKGKDKNKVEDKKKEDKKKSGDDKKKEEERSETRMDLYPTITPQPSKFHGKTIHYGQVEALRLELKRTYSTEAERRVDEEYQKTRKYFYNRQLDKMDEYREINRDNMRFTYFAYLQNNPGSKKAVHECVRESEQKEDTKKEKAGKEKTDDKRETAKKPEKTDTEQSKNEKTDSKSEPKKSEDSKNRSSGKQEPHAAKSKNDGSRHDHDNKNTKSSKEQGKNDGYHGKSEDKGRTDPDNKNTKSSREQDKKDDYHSNSDNKGSSKKVVSTDNKENQRKEQSVKK